MKNWRNSHSIDHKESEEIQTFQRWVHGENWALGGAGVKWVKWQTGLEQMFLGWRLKT